MQMLIFIFLLIISVAALVLTKREEIRDRKFEKRIKDLEIMISESDACIDALNIIHAKDLSDRDEILEEQLVNFNFHLFNYQTLNRWALVKFILTGEPSDPFNKNIAHMTELVLLQSDTEWLNDLLVAYSKFLNGDSLAFNEIVKNTSQDLKLVLPSKEFESLN